MGREQWIKYSILLFGEAIWKARSVYVLGALET